MCQLLAISSTAPTPTFSSSLLSPFVQRGGNTDVHSHGWGVAYSNYCALAKKVRIKTIRDASPAATSTKIQRLIMNQSKEKMLNTQSLLAHIRYATVGEVSIDNVHPFHRELFGVEFTFAHNGDVPMFKKGRRRSSRSSSSDSSRSSIDFNTSYGENVEKFEDEEMMMRFEPFGDTDSEQIFCHILNSLSAQFDSFPGLDEIYHAIYRLCLEIVQHDGVILNFLLGVGEHIFAYSWPGQRPGSSTWNGLFYMLKSKQVLDDDKRTNIPAIKSCDVNKAQIAVIATKPLGPDQSLWKEFRKGDLLLFCNGTVSKTSCSISNTSEIYQ